jgi:hypothetical protein
MIRVTDRARASAGPRVRLRRISRSCLYVGPNRHRSWSLPGPGARPGVPRSRCRYTLQTTPPPFLRRKR